ncbi:MAG: UDP-N-acetylmuramate:L-alanyl-gamma-D-glutamyl-meso-diaminopimelate ligase [Pseudomonadota bacterium]
MRIHILGICGTFMGSLALLAKQMGHEVTGSDAGVYPPMSTQLEAQGIICHEGYSADALSPAPDCVVIGNALVRGNPAVEYILNKGLPYQSGPQWLAEHVLQNRHVLAVTGTHGKTTVTSMLAWILEYAGLSPGFLVGGVPQNFGLSARLGESDYFVIESDEYDTAFFDKRSKFIHYHPRTLILNNLEFDHADIFPDLAAIQRSFHHLVRTIPAEGRIIWNNSQHSLAKVLSDGCWTPLQSFGAGDSDWRSQLLNDSGTQFEVLFKSQKQGEIYWQLLGMHNRNNALAAIAAAYHVGVSPAEACRALCEFKGIKRRLEVRGVVNDITIYDDFAHHPTAITTTLEGLRKQVGSARIIAVLEPRSNTMKMGAHRDTLAPSLQQADAVMVYHTENWTFPASGLRGGLFDDIDALLSSLIELVASGDHVVIMSNGGFQNVHQRLLDALAEKYEADGQ